MCKYYLHGGPEETIQRLSGTVLRIMKSDNLVEDMAVPPEISPPEKKIYLYFLIYLSEDKFADHLNMQNHGFVAVLDPNLISPGIQGQKSGGETRIQSSGSVLPADKEPESDKSGGVTASGLLGLMIKSSL